MQPDDVKVNVAFDETYEVKGESKEKTRVLVLYIEDNISNQKFMENLLSRRPGYQLSQATTSDAGLELAFSINPDLILLDINMPEMDGFEVLKKLKEAKKTANIPVIAVTASAMPENIAEGLDAGFDDYMTKPVDIEKLMAAMEKLLPA
jgi:CheY-like chemotaxis protein